MSNTDINNKDKVNKKINEQNVSVYAYDLALVSDLRKRFEKPNNKQLNDEQVNDIVQIGPSNRMFEILGTLNEDKVMMPFVSLERLDWQLNLDRQGYQTFIGDKIYTKLDEHGAPIDVRAQVIPITINYRLSVWSKDRVTNDALIRELLFYYHLRPTLMAYIGHGLNFTHTFNIYFNSNVEDNSDIANHSNNGTYFRQDLTLYTNDAYLWRANYEPRVKVTPEIYFNYGNEFDMRTVDHTEFNI